jgi:hypothetical protein
VNTRKTIMGLLSKLLPILSSFLKSNSAKDLKEKGIDLVADKIKKDDPLVEAGVRLVEDKLEDLVETKILKKKKKGSR